MIQLLKAFSVVMSISLLTACAAHYEPETLFGGYSDVQINDTEFRVAFKGSKFTTDKRVQMFLLRRCAEITREHGRKYFTLDDIHSHAPNLKKQPASSVHDGTYVDQAYGHHYKDLDGIQGRKIIYNGQRHVVVTMKIYKKKQPQSYDADFILEQFEGKDRWTSRI